MEVLAGGGATACHGMSRTRTTMYIPLERADLMVALC